MCLYYNHVYITMFKVLYKLIRRYKYLEKAFQENLKKVCGFVLKIYGTTVVDPNFHDLLQQHGHFPAKINIEKNFKAFNLKYNLSIKMV